MTPLTQPLVLQEAKRFAGRGCRKGLQEEVTGRGLQEQGYGVTGKGLQGESYGKELQEEGLQEAKRVAGRGLQEQGLREGVAVRKTRQ